MAGRLPTVVSLVAGITHPGDRRTTNEDCFSVGEIAGDLTRGPGEVIERLVSVEVGFVLGVYDGTGSKGAVEVASATAARVVGDEAFSHSRTSLSGEAELCARLVQAVNAASAAVLADAGARTETGAAWGPRPRWPPWPASTS